MSSFMAAAMMNDWSNTPTFFNDGTADSIITDAGTVANTYVVASGGAAVVAGHLVRASGFALPVNNQVFRAASSTATTILGTALGLIAEAAPPAAAKLKVVGFSGAVGDITATASGLASTALNFTTLGLVVGKWINIGGTAVGDKFATAVLNDYARITAIAANALTLDNLPTGWAVDAGAGKTIKVWFGDHIKNGTTRKSSSIEFGYMGQPTPSYTLCKGQVPNTFELSGQSRGKITGSFGFSGMGGVISETTVDALPDARASGQVFAANANVARMSAGGTKLVMPNCAREFSVQVNNNLRKIECIDDDSPVDIVEGECTVTGKVNTYFGSKTEKEKFINGTPTSFSQIIAKNSQAIIVEVPRATYRSGSNPVQGKNTDVMFTGDYQASIDEAVTNAHIVINRMEYLEA